MKKKVIVFLSLISIGFSVYWIVFSRHSSFNSSSNNDTIFVKQLCDSAKSIEQSKPDSAVLLYLKAIKKFESLPLDDKTRHLLANVYVDLSCVYIPQGKYDKAKELRIKALRIAGEADLDIKAKVLTQDGLISYHQSQFDDAMKLYDQAGLLARKINNRKLQTKLFSNKAIIYYGQGNIKMAVAGFNESLRFAKKLNDPALISDAYINLGVVYMDQMDYARARECYATAIDYYRKNRQYQDLILCYRNLGNVYYMQEKYGEAIDWYQKSLEMAIELDNKIGIAKGYHNIGEVYMLIGDYVRANNTFIRSLKIKESIGDKASIAKGYRSLGDLYFIQKNYKKSLSYQQKALQINTRLQLVKEQAKDYANISVVYGEQKQLAQAIAYCSKAVKLAQQIGDTYGVAEDTRTLGGFYFLQKNYTQAELYYQKAVAWKKTLNDQEGLAAVYSQLAELYTNKPAAGVTKKQNLQIALDYALRAYALAESVKIPRLISDVSSDLSDIYKKLNNYPKAYHFLEINKRTNDSIFNKSKTEALTFAEARWNNEKKQEQIASLEKLNRAISAQKLAESKRHRMVVIGLMLIFVLVVIVAGLYWLYRYKQREITHQKQLSRISMLRLQNIRNRISPHFIFNVLNREISSGADNDKYQEMIGLVTFLRRSLEITEKTSVSLDEELAFVRNYLQMEQRSLNDDFRVKWNIDESVDSRLLQIPAMIMQIPIENAMKHALRTKEGEKLLNISILKQAVSVQITIQDNGAGYHPEKQLSSKGTGTGLKVLYQTIDVLNSKNNEKICLNIEDVQDRVMTGTRVKITVPDEYNFEI
jgi:tetratricopeptide (TPR) repeat protein